LEWTKLVRGKTPFKKLKAAERDFSTFLPRSITLVLISVRGMKSRLFYEKRVAKGKKRVVRRAGKGVSRAQRGVVEKNDTSPSFAEWPVGSNHTLV